MSMLASGASFAFELTLRATAIFAATSVALFVLRRGSATTRHGVGMLGLAAALALPILSLALPRISVPVLPHLAVVRAGTVPNWTPVALLAWAAGSILVAARLFAGWVRVRRMSDGAAPVSDAEWIADRDAAARRLALRRAVDVREADGIPAAVTSGWRRPLLLVGRAARLWAADRRRVVLLHELAHVKRGDWPALLLAELAVALYWFHPLAQWIGRRVRRDAEQACDELVIGTGTKPSVYAAHLLGIFRSAGGAPTASPALAIARPHHFEERLRAILEPGAAIGASPASRAHLATAGLFAAAAMATLVSPWKPACVSAAPAASIASRKECARPPCPKAGARALPAAVVAPADEVEPSEEAPADETPAAAPAIWRDEPGFRRPAAGFVKASNGGRTPRDGDDWYDRGMQLHRRERYTEAIAAFQKAIEEGYREDAASYNIACGYALLGDRDKAFEWLHRAMDEGFDVAAYLHDDDLDALHADPRWAELNKTVREAKSSEEKSEARSVANRYERLVARAPKSGEPFFSIGRELLRVDSYELAAKAYQAAIERDYRPGTSYYNQACAFSLDGKKDAALDALQHALDAGFDQPDMFDSDDDLDAIRSDPRFQALAREAEHLSLPGYGGNGWWGGRSRSARAKWREAAKTFSAYAEKNPKIGRAWFNLGYASLAADRPDEAAAAFQKALDLGYRKPTTMYNLACSYARLDQKDAAFDWLFKALDAGFDENWTLRTDDDLDNLRGDSRYRKAVQMARDHDRVAEK